MAMQMIVKVDCVFCGHETEQERFDTFGATASRMMNCLKCNLSTDLDDMAYINRLVSEQTAFPTLMALCSAPGYRPSIRPEQDGGVIANAYDTVMEFRGDERRAYRG